MNDGAAGRVLRISGGSYRVEVGEDLVTCVLAGRLKQGDGPRVSVGDLVRCEETGEGEGRIVELLPRSSKLARRAVTGRAEQVIVANVDQLVPVFAVARPSVDTTMLDRLLVLAELHGLDAFVVVNKADLGDPEGFEDYREAGYEVVPTSAAAGTGLGALSERLRDRTSALAGPSGAGKSSLLNRLVPGLDRRVGEVSSGDEGRGRHTTVNATLVPLPDGGYVADTPGLQVLRLWSMDPDELAAAFPEFRPWLGSCRFNDCRHVEEPGCGIRRALQEDTVAERRYHSYRMLLEEAEEERRTW